MSGLLAPLRLPERVVAAAEAVGDAAKLLRPMSDDLAAVRAETERLNHSMLQLAQEVIAMHATLRAVQEEMQAVTERLPEPGSSGPLAKARDMLSGGD